MWGTLWPKRFRIWSGADGCVSKKNKIKRAYIGKDIKKYSSISLSDLLVLNEKGWIPGPEEEIESFLKRVDTLFHFFSYPPEEVNLFLTDSDWQIARLTTKKLYGFSPDWIVAHYSNKDLSFFQGAATWTLDRLGTHVPLIQLKEKFAQGSLLKIYSKEEVLSHEAVHAARMEFDEPYFEELLAYRTSSSFFRRSLSPLFQKPWESYLFIFLLFIPLSLEIGQFFYPLSIWIIRLSFLPFVFFCFLFLRLMFLQLCLFLCVNKLKALRVASDKRWPLMLRLKDREIFQGAFFSKKRFCAILEEGKSLRHKLIKAAYFKNRPLA